MAFSFGQPAQTASTSAQPAPTFSFGGANSSAQKPSGGFTFGATPAQTQQQQQQPASNSLFGNAGQQQNNQQPQQTGFGSSLFGQPAQQQQQQQQQPQQSGTSLFGNTNTTSSGLFGQQGQQQNQSQANKPAYSFGSTTNANPPSTSANPLTLSQLNAQPSYQQQQTQNRPFGFQSGTTANIAGGSASTNRDSNAQKRLGILVNDKLEAIRAAWDVRDLQSCRFLYYFYNAIPSQPPGLGEASLANPNFGRRGDAIGPRHDAMWLQTLRENPDRSKLVSVLAIGFPDLKARLEMQQSETQRQSAKLVDLRKRLDDLTSKHTLSNSVRISAISRKQTSLHHRLISIARRIHLLIPALRGQSVTLKEEQLKSILQNCELELESLSLAADARGSSGQFNYTTRLRGRVNELWALLGNVKARREAALAAEGPGGGKPLEWAVVDESALEDVAKILASQQQGLDHLSTTLQNDTRSLETVMKGLEGVELTGVK